MLVPEDIPEDVLTAEQLEARRKAAEEEAQAIIRAEKERKAQEEAIAAAKAQLRRCKEMVRSAAIGRRAQVSILISEGAVPNFIFEVSGRGRGRRLFWSLINSPCNTFPRCPPFRVAQHCVLQQNMVI